MTPADPVQPKRDALLPCPWPTCGGAGQYVLGPSIGHKTTYTHYIMCLACNCTTPMCTTWKEAADIWNRPRIAADPVQPVGVTDAMVEAAVNTYCAYAWVTRVPSHPKWMRAALEAAERARAAEQPQAGAVEPWQGILREASDVLLSYAVADEKEHERGGALIGPRLAARRLSRELLNTPTPAARQSDDAAAVLAEISTVAWADPEPNCTVESLLAWLRCALQPTTAKPTDTPASVGQAVAFIDPDGGLHMLADGAADFLRDCPDFTLLYAAPPPVDRVEYRAVTLEDIGDLGLDCVNETALENLQRIGARVPVKGV